MSFLFIGWWLSPSLPSHGRSPFRSWLQIVLSSFVFVFRFHSIDRGLEPLLVSVHAGHTQGVALNTCPAASSIRHDHSTLKPMISWIFVIVAIVLLLFGISTGVGTFSWVREARSVTGTVVELVQKKSSSKKGSKYSYAPRVRYKVDGEEREFVSSQSSSSPDFKVGENVQVATNLKRGHECIATFGELYGFSLVASLLGFSMLAATLCFMNGTRLLRLLHPNLG